MRTLDMNDVMSDVIESAVAVNVSGDRTGVFVDAEQVEAIPAVACINGDATRKGKLNELFGYLRNHVEPYNGYETDVDGRRQYHVKRVEVHAVSNIDEVAEGNAPEILDSAGDPKNRGRGRRMPRVARTGNVNNESFLNWANELTPAQ